MFELYVNNGNLIQLSQAESDGPITVTVEPGDTEYTIQAGEMTMLLNYFRACKNGFVQSDFIAASK